MQIRTLLACIMLAVLAPGCAPRPRPTASAEPPAAQSATTPPASPATPPKLVVLVVVDQLPSWWFEKHLSRFADSDQGIARLLREGTYYSQATYPYAVTFTAAGHAALGTGAPPSVTGVLDNSWYRPDIDCTLPATYDPGGHVFVLAGATTPAPARSGTVMRVDGIADVLEARNADSRTVSISLKDRAAAFVAGRQPDLAIWYEEKQPAMTTSRFYVKELPAWLRDLHASGLVSQQRNSKWEIRDGIDYQAITGSDDPAPGETSDKLVSNEFPHEIAKSSDPSVALRATPAGDDIVFATARRAIAAMELGGDEVPDFLALSFSAHDYAGHYWGPDSWERFDIFLHFDEALASFLTTLDERIGRGNYALVLTSDHGAPQLIERTGGLRVMIADIKTVANAAVARKLETQAAIARMRKPKAAVAGKSWVAGISTSTLHLSRDIEDYDLADRKAALDALVAAIKGIPGIDKSSVVLTDEVSGNCETRTGFEAMACLSLIPGESGHVFYAAEPNSIITEYAVGINHGSPHDYDRQVPVIVYAPGDPRWSSPRTVSTPVSTLQAAPTLAELLGISAPPAAKEKPLP